MSFKPRYRFKGKWANGERKIIIEYPGVNAMVSKICSFTLPKARTLLKVLKNREILKETKDVKNPSLSEPLVNGSWSQQQDKEIEEDLKDERI